MSLIKVRRIATLDSEAKDSIADKEREYTRLYELAQKNITFYAAKGDSAKVAEWKRKADEYKRLAQEATDAKDSAATDASFKKGDKVVSVKTGAQGVVSEVYGEEKYAVLFNGASNPDRVEGFQIRLSNSRAADASGTDAKFQKGDKVRVWQQPVYGKLGEVVEATYGGMEYTVNVEGKDYPRIDYRRIVKVSNTAGDAAEFRVGQRVRAKDPAYEYSDGKALGAGMFTVKEVRNNGDVKLDDGGDVWISPSALVEANDACGKGEDAENFRVGQKVKHTRFGTIGKVFEIAPDGAIGVQWGNGQAYYGKFHAPLSEIVAVNE